MPGTANEGKTTLQSRTTLSHQNSCQPKYPKQPNCNFWDPLQPEDELQMTL